MHRPRLIPIALLLVATALPYSAPTVCAVVRPDMTDAHMATMRDGSQVTSDSTGDWCDLVGCATAPVAPVAAFASPLAVVPLADLQPAFSVTGLDVEPAAPLTPPPLV